MRRERKFAKKEAVETNQQDAVNTTLSLPALVPYFTQPQQGFVGCVLGSAARLTHG